MRLLTKDVVKHLDREARLRLCEFARASGTPLPVFEYEVRGTKKKVYHFCTVSLPLDLDTSRKLGLRELRGAGLARVKKDSTALGAMSAMEMLEFGLEMSMEEIIQQQKQKLDLLVAKAGIAAPSADIRRAVNAVPKDIAAGMGVDLKTLKKVGGEDAVNAARMVYLVATEPPKVAYYEQLAKDGVHPQVNVTFFVVPRMPSKKNPEMKPEKLVAVAHGGAEDHRDEVEVIAFLKAAKMLVGPLGKRRCREVLRQVREYPNLGLAAVFPQLSSLQSNGLRNALEIHRRAFQELIDSQGLVYKRSVLRRLEVSNFDPDMVHFPPQWERSLTRKPLPIDDIEDDLLGLLDRYTTVIVEGGTGSGKTTRIPQFLLDDALRGNRGHECCVLVAEPRRISAISAASRVAHERGDVVGDPASSVGYHIRLERKAPRPRGCIEFVTTGVLLRRLQANPSLEGVSHVIVDEVHERDSDTDFLLAALREAQQVPRETPLRTIVMSATLDSGRLQAYFQDCTRIGVPSGPLFDVSEIHLEELAPGEFSGREIWSLARKLERLESNAKPGQPVKEQTITHENLVIAGQGKAGEQLRTLAIERYQAGDIPQTGRVAVLSGRGREGLKPQLFEGNVNDYGKTVESEEEDVMDNVIVELMAEVVARLIKQRRVPAAGTAGGCILCFLPGWEEIQRVRQSLVRMVGEADVVILPLHSSIPNRQQNLVFESVPRGCVKVVLATNIAETSITIPDVTVVVDSGRVKELNYHSISRYSSLDVVHVSRSSIDQRRGRAGRVRPGFCYRLFTRSLMSRLLPQAIPEMRRCSLESLCLQAKAISQKNVGEFLATALDPPSPARIQKAMDELVLLGAIRRVSLRDARPNDNSLSGEENREEDEVITYREELTPLGEHLAALPVDPGLGRMLLMSIILGGLETGLTIAAVLSVPDIFQSPTGARTSKSVQQRFCATSDVLAMVAAYNTWGTILRDRGPRAAENFAMDNQLSSSSLSMIEGIRRQLRGVLRSRGFFSRPEHERDQLLVDLNENGGRLGLQLALVCLAVPNLGHRTTGSQNVVTRAVYDALVHPNSVNSTTPGSRAAWYLYSELVETSRPYIRNTTVVSSLEIVLYGGSFFNDDALGGCVLDHWILTKGDPQTIQLLISTRRAINDALERLCLDPSRVPLASEKRLVAATFELIEQSRGAQVQAASSSQLTTM